jgi:hypothetical protein
MTKLIARIGPAASWASRDIEICTGCVKRGTAVIEALLPVAAVVVGLIAFGIVVHFVAG